MRKTIIGIGLALLVGGCGDHVGPPYDHDFREGDYVTAYAETGLVVTSTQDISKVRVQFLWGPSPIPGVVRSKYRTEWFEEWELEASEGP